MSEVEFVSAEPQTFEVYHGEVLTIDTGFGVAHTVEGKPIPPAQNGSSTIELYSDESSTVQGADGVEYTIRGRGAAEGKGTTERIELSKGESVAVQGSDGVEYVAEGQGDPAWLTGVNCAIWAFFGWFTLGHFWPSPW